jgi:hypothetical protein
VRAAAFNSGMILNSVLRLFLLRILDMSDERLIRPELLERFLCSGALIVLILSCSHAGRPFGLS